HLAADDPELLRAKLQRTAAGAFRPKASDTLLFIAPDPFSDISVQPRFDGSIFEAVAVGDMGKRQKAPLNAGIPLPVGMFEKSRTVCVESFWRALVYLP